MILKENFPSSFLFKAVFLVSDFGIFFMMRIDDKFWLSFPGDHMRWELQVEVCGLHDVTST